MSGNDLPGLLCEIIDQADLHIPSLALATARLLPMVWLAPTFGGRLVPPTARLAITLGLALVLAPPASWEAAATPLDAGYVAAMSKEVLFGLACGLIARFPFELARGAGHLIDVTRGAAMAQVLAPGLGDRATPMGDILYLALLATVTAMGGDRLIILALSDGFLTLPPGMILAPDATSTLAEAVLVATGTLMSTALMLAAPAIVVALLSDTVLGVVGRIVPQLPLFFLGMPVKTLLGVIIICAALGPALTTLVSEGAFASDLLVDLARLTGESRG